MHAVAAVVGAAAAAIDRASASFVPVSSAFGPALFSALLLRGVQHAALQLLQYENQRGSRGPPFPPARISADLKPQCEAPAAVGPFGARALSAPPPFRSYVEAF